MYRRKSFLILFALMCEIFILTSPAAAQFGPNRSTISGFVFDSRRRPVAEVRVELLNEVDTVIRRTRTDNSGRYSFIGLPQGRFTIRVLPLGTNFEEKTQAVEITGTGVRGQPLADHIQQDIYLRVRKEPAGASSITGTIFAQEVPEEARQVYKVAVSDLDDKKIESGIEGLKKAIGIFPKYFEALKLLGIVLTNRAEYSGAREAFARAAGVNERSFESWYGLGHSSYSLHDSTAAIDAAGKAVALRPDSVEANLLLGISYRQGTNYELAETSLKQADKLSDHQSPDVHWNLALLYAHNLNRFNDAATHLELYLKTAGDIPNKNAVKKLIKQLRQKGSAN